MAFCAIHPLMPRVSESEEELQPRASDSGEEGFRTTWQ